MIWWAMTLLWKFIFFILVYHAQLSIPFSFSILVHICSEFISNFSKQVNYHLQLHLWNWNTYVVSIHFFSEPSEITLNIVHLLSYMSCSLIQNTMYSYRRSKQGSFTTSRIDSTAWKGAGKTVHMKEQNLWKRTSSWSTIAEKRRVKQEARKNRNTCTTPISSEDEQVQAPIADKGVKQIMHAMEESQAIK